jgi:NAD(P)-dependent dehydrogenase (short-subunit alcohol dehydrogenase family)
MTSILAFHPSPAHFPTHAYAAAKGAIVSLTTTMAAYYAPRMIRVNAVAPSLTRTPMAGRAASDPETVAFAAWKQPLVGGLLEPEDVADAAAFLLSSEARAITGQVLKVDGGFSVSELPAEQAP